MTTLRNEKYQCVYVPEGADEVCTVLCISTAQNRIYQTYNRSPTTVGSIPFTDHEGIIIVFIEKSILV